MKSCKTLCFGAASILAGFANAACTPCGSVKCLGALAEDPAVGEAFCSSWLALAPATTTVTEIETVTTTAIGLETALTTVTVVTGTATVTTGSATTLFQKRAPTIVNGDDEPAPTTLPEDPKEVIISKCSSNGARISKACGCFLSTATTSTVTITETATSTEGLEAMNTVVETVTTNVVETVSVAPPTVTIPPNIIVNGAFEEYITNGNISPWTDTQATTGGQIQVINGVNPCVSGGDCAGGRIVVRAYPPKTGGGYVGLVETFVGRPSTTYALSFVYRCLNYDANSRIQAYYNGALIGTASNCINSAAFVRASNIQFTTDASGRGELQIRFANPSNLQYLYFYADDFKAIAV